VRRIGPRSRIRAAGNVQVVFQNPYRALDPMKPVIVSVAEPLLAHPGSADDGDPMRRAAAALSDVGIASRSLYRYPKEFSGGQLQRIAIARALVSRPTLVVCDEPVSALDVSVRGQILNLLVTQQRRLGITYLLISHDIGVIRLMTQRVAVLYRGRIVESGPTAQVCGSPSHDYTRALMNAVPGL
jgi:peptide/nickel transport system ATP-binding protein